MAARAMNTGANACPDLEMIAAYIDHQLTERERARITEHLASCETCYFVFTEAAQMRASEDAARATAEQSGLHPLAERHWSRPAVWRPAAAALAIAATLVIAVATGALLWRSDPAPGLQALVAAVGTDRTIEPRLTGGFQYGPLRGPTRNADRPVDELHVSADIRIAAAQIEKQANQRRSADALHAVGIAYLVTGDLRRAIGALEEASTSDDAGVWSDLAAAYLVNAVREHRPIDLQKALSAADHAVLRDPHRAESLFNRASALEQLSRMPEAKLAWQEYLKVDEQSGWAAEARIHLQRLSPESF